MNRLPRSALRSHKSAFILLALFVSAPQAAAQTAIPPDAGGAPPAAANEAAPNEITIIGRRQVSGIDVSQYLNAILAETRNGRVARWADRICLNVVGVGNDYRNYLVDRMEAVAQNLRLEIVPQRPCEPSAYIIFTPDPTALRARLEDQRPGFFGSLSGAEREAFWASAAPVRWLSSAQLRGAHGETPFSFSVDPKTGGVERPVPGMRGTASRLATGSRMDLQTMLVLVDTSKIAGLSNQSLADYLTMVVLGNIRPEHDVIARESILSIFARDRVEGAIIADGMSDWDRAYLRSFYSGDWSVPPEQRVDRIRDSMARNLDSEHSEGR
ncbi:hypothetical protein RCO27_06820 [Sphingosinicella sp. LHD-64]|uniref:hypothetical protein n=1 Tax=Sphingosinicella sp. LHD-64 TaxID=3072139 RepID=UPI00280F526E|nr:hypothetical protein [Sphingosinicella sp. LHD-64]MDQ8755938.1 hypothetical protein [Sphingosinicella sp. LHD-64]